MYVLMDDPTFGFGKLVLEVMLHCHPADRGGSVWWPAELFSEIFKPCITGAGILEHMLGLMVDNFVVDL